MALVQSRAWNLHPGGYAQSRINKRAVYMHRLIVGDAINVDHINGNKLDNRRCNLRAATVTENRWNEVASKVARSKYKGVTFDQRYGFFAARICIDYKKFVIATLKNEHHAALAYDYAARLLQKEHGRYNFPRPNEQPALEPDQQDESVTAEMASLDLEAMYPLVRKKLAALRRSIESSSIP